MNMAKSQDVYQIQAKHQIVFKGFVEVTDELGYNKTLFFPQKIKA